ncbi:MAG TPA: c-type cytochrome domain-containing protein, partial [Pirellulales bacterium]|nr:c-type cytochrome domain-containing protein [Pirellulales bacterium]
MRHACVLLLLAMVVASAPARADESRDAPSTPDQLTFEADVRPILKVHCTHCHGEADEREGGLDVRLRRLIVAGGDSGPAIDLQSPHDSLLLQRLRDGEMPPGEKKLSKREFKVIERWVEQGSPTSSPEPETIGAEGFVSDEDR